MGGLTIGDWPGGAVTKAYLDTRPNLSLVTCRAPVALSAAVAGGFHDATAASLSVLQTNKTWLLAAVKISPMRKGTRDVFPLLFIHSFVQRMDTITLCL